MKVLKKKNECFCERNVPIEMRRPCKQNHPLIFLCQLMANKSFNILCCSLKSIKKREQCLMCSPLLNYAWISSQVNTTPPHPFTAFFFKLYVYVMEMYILSRGIRSKCITFHHSVAGIVTTSVSCM